MKKSYLILKISYILCNKFIRKCRFLINKYFFRVGKKEIFLKLRKIGLEKGSLVYVHGAMSSFGYVKGYT